MPTTPCTIRPWRAGGTLADLTALLRRAAAAFAVAAPLAAVVPAVAQEMDTSLGESVVMVPAGGITEPTLEVTVYRPPGDGPFPVLVVDKTLISADLGTDGRYALVYCHVHG